MIEMQTNSLMLTMCDHRFNTYAYFIYFGPAAKVFFFLFMSTMEMLIDWWLEWEMLCNITVQCNDLSLQFEWFINFII